MDTINFGFEAPLTKPVDQDAPKVGPPTQDADSSEYICGSTGPAFEGRNPGRDQDRSRQDECQPASPFARYVG